jgi:hypothetical protein
MSLLDDIDITMLKGDIEMAKQELMLKIGDLETELTNKINSDDFSYANNQINIKLNTLDEVINAYRNKLSIFERKLEQMDDWFTRIAAYAQYTSNQEFKEITNKISEYKSIEE